MKSHKRSCSDKGKHACTKCPKTFQKKSNLKSHYDVHLGEKSYSCDKCDNRFFHSGSLNRHKLVKHEKTQSYVCETCSKSFSRKDWLKTHMRGHTGESPFSCDFCDQKYKDKRPLVNHLMKAHNEEYKEPAQKENRKEAVKENQDILISEYFKRSAVYELSIEDSSVKKKWEKQKPSNVKELIGSKENNCSNCFRW